MDAGGSINHGAMMKSTRVYVHDAKEVPSCEHWAIISGTSVTIPGDERSRTNPGHGYPESTEHYITYEAFTDEAEFKAELTRRIESNAKYYSSREVRGIHVTGIYQPETTIKLTERK
jgi:hypothetical protein